jgi:hypothetical protein
VAAISSNCSSVVNQFRSQVPAENTLRNCCYPLAVHPVLPANSYVDSWFEWETSDGQRLIELAHGEGVLTSISVRKAIVAMILAGDLETTYTQCPSPCPSKPSLACIFRLEKHFDH